MKQFFSENRLNFRRAVCYTLLVYLLCHGYRLFSLLFTGDTLLMFYEDDAAWQIAVGRFCFPFLIMLRGSIEAPWLLSVLAMLWMCGAVCITTELFSLKKWWQILAVSLLYCTNPSFIALNATDLYCIDFYALALFLALLGARLCLEKKLLTSVLAVFAFTVSLGIYQAYICVALGVLMLHFVQELQREKKFMPLLKEALRTGASLAAAAVLYVICFKLFQKAFNIWTAKTFIDLDGLGDYSESSVFSVLKETFARVWQYVKDPTVFVSLTFRGKDMSVIWSWILRLAELGLSGCALWHLIRTAVSRKNKWWQYALQALLLILLPLGINFVCFASKGMQHPLMCFAFCLLWLVPLLGEAGSGTKRSIALPLIALLCWSNIVYANQVYVKIETRDIAAQELMNGINQTLTQTEGYIPGETEVAFIGSFNDNPYIQPFERLERLEEWSMRKTALAYSGTEEAYYRYFSAIGMKAERPSEITEEMRALPVYPQKGYAAMIDGVMVVKLSEEVE
ncbi:MAG: glucosyltransferase domain-containing protein [Lachnospiraceae bacterium]|nr:glucosyltransferase domain-containing protein [Lachnospiraceae bacterium]